MATFPTLLTPNSTLPLIGASPYLDVGNGGRVVTRTNSSLGLEWTETYEIDPKNTDHIGWLAQLEHLFANGQVITNKKYHLVTSLIGAGGTLKVSGSGQTGNQIILYGATPSSTPLKAGDLIMFGTGSLVHQISADCVADASGGATASIMPQILSGFVPLNTATLTLTPAVSFSCVITSLQIGEYSPLSPNLSAPITIRLRQTPL